MTRERPRVLAVSDYFLPGFKGGGPIRTLANMRSALRDEVMIDLFTRDRDLGMGEPYRDIVANRWSEDVDGRIFYADPQYFGPSGIRAALKAAPYDLVYLNSFFSSRGSVRIVTALRGQAQAPRLLIAPRGEFSPGALALKMTKKSLFLRLMHLLQMYRDVDWHVSSEAERSDLLAVFPKASDRAHVASDPVALAGDAPLAPPKRTGALRLAFLSRISPMKNLDFLLEVLAEVRLPVSLTIYGPLEDTAYWQHCQRLIAKLPAHISATWEGEVEPEEVSPVFARHDVFAFPTRGENFGHVIFESLRAGTPVILSDQTPWESRGGNGLQVMSLSDKLAWRNAIEDAACRDDTAQNAARKDALAYAQAYAKNDVGAADTLAMFRKVAARVNGGFQ